MKTTITEALAEIKTTGKRIEKKREYVRGFLFRQDGVKDPLEKTVTGGSPAAIKAERQGIADLEENLLKMRRGIQRANEETMVTVLGIERSIADWLVWRRDVAPNQQAMLSLIRQTVNQARNTARTQGVNVLAPGQTGDKPQDYVINIDEAALAKEIEDLETTLGTLDGQLSLKNATVTFEI